MKVRLIQLPTVSPSPPVSFQFHEGSINTLRLAHQATLLRYFNSMKVRLIHTLAPIWAAAHQFQFHEGSINTEDSEQRKRPPRPFQFHEGSINTISSFSFLATRFNFNSMKVRLIRTTLTKKDLNVLYFNSMKVRLIHLCVKYARIVRIFQFHEGSINTQSSSLGTPCLLPFQFHEGSINTANHYFDSYRTHISIPWRFD